MVLRHNPPEVAMAPQCQYHLAFWGLRGGMPIKGGILSKDRNALKNGVRARRKPSAPCFSNVIAIEHRLRQTWHGHRIWPWYGYTLLQYEMKPSTRSTYMGRMSLLSMCKACSQQSHSSHGEGPSSCCQKLGPQFDPIRHLARIRLATNSTPQTQEAKKLGAVREKHSSGFPQGKINLKPPPGFPRAPSPGGNPGGKPCVKRKIGLNPRLTLTCHQAEAMLMLNSQQLHGVGKTTNLGGNGSFATRRQNPTHVCPFHNACMP